MLGRAGWRDWYRAALSARGRFKWRGRGASAVGYPREVSGRVAPDGETGTENATQLTKGWKQ